MKNEVARPANLYFSFFMLYFSFSAAWCAVSRRAHSDSAAQRERAGSSPNRVSRKASLLRRTAADGADRPAPSRKTNGEKSLGEKGLIPGGGIIGIPGQRIKAGWRGCCATQVSLLLGVTAPQNRIDMVGRFRHWGKTIVGSYFGNTSTLVWATFADGLYCGVGCRRVR